MRNQSFRLFTNLQFKLAATLVFTCVMSLFAVPAVAKERPSLVGDWQLNRDLTEERRPKVKKTQPSRSGFGSNVAVGAGGVLMPVPKRQGGPSAGGATANLPKILACQELTLVQQGSDIVVTCPQMLEPRKFVIGKIHGRTVRWSNRKLTEKYSSTSRRVTHEFNLERSGVMEIKITVKPKGAKRLTYILVFDPVPVDAQHS